MTTRVGDFGLLLGILLLQLTFGTLDLWNCSSWCLYMLCMVAQVF